MKKFILIFLLTFTAAVAAEAQCHMCKASVESGMEDENAKGKGLNQGILYLLATPYLAIATIGGAWYYKNKKK